ncbi:mitochondrial ribosome-associated GTPase 2 isoform X1 [Neodiprion pinetum]|uniref:Mitochondrial ribosome-associated GTPase 2 n=1 Tax=Neodiprion lecontei TaxID=441921 RepID=A0A6J0BZP0_NEOLC|nr:mitochondrial ribosome-associated GTPase 2 [Neodiprion lecontei]XP_046469202.1 mitochondrial ribosome-associated GTPase 2 [Neodiprion pinetum]
MQSLRRLGTSSLLRTIIRIQDILPSCQAVHILDPSIAYEITNRSFHNASCLYNGQAAVALRHRKPKAQGATNQYFIDMKQVTVIAGNGGDGAISFLHLWANEFAGPDGGDGGSGGHVIFQASTDVNNLSHVKTILSAPHGEKGQNKDCFGKNADNFVVNVPVGTIVRSLEGKIVADLGNVGMMFIAARGGAGGHGNAFFKSDIEQSPKISEYGAKGESFQYLLELRSMANIGLIGLPNAGKSTLLRAISRARPKVAPYPFTTLKPHVGMVQYNDYEQVAVADLPGLIADSHKNRGLGITFLKHAERCAALLIVLDMSMDEPWEDLELLQYELQQFSKQLADRPVVVIANKMDLPESQENLNVLKEKTQLQIVPISAKMGQNLSTLVAEIRMLYNNETGKDFYGQDRNKRDEHEIV